ncbi:c6 zinc finger domain-containing protein [Ophiostoma piceae UAMH 11346]|uniref:C6 zinc finger domain-containing protein n=1 Tax=Ophiostoma piceae (strain UAMH 11346) TaxID=1262450 RepID=S3BM19_OPHP1|nr:c6 zinc finger domain-containing protein [Ophiostoma piceae UAMH 11346]
MPAQSHRRMPLSCQPCRERKIRCSRDPTRTAGSPCASCIRRGIPPHECVYLRDIYARRPPPAPACQESGAVNGGSDNVSTNSDLVERIRKLEAIISRTEATSTNSIGLNAGGYPAAPVSSSSKDPSTSCRRPSAAHEIGAIDIPCTDHDPQRPISYKGNIIPYTSGHERYEPVGAAWSSVLHNMATPMVDSPSDDSEIPFVAGPTEIEHDHLLADLPAMSHCDELKNVYFDVFAPVIEYARFLEHPTAVPRAWLALLYAILGVAVLALDGSSPLLRNLGWRGITGTAQNVAILTGRYRVATLRCLEADHYLWRHNLHTLQALILLVYGINHSHGQSWALLGTTRNIALALGCHVDPDQLRRGGARITRVEAEQRRRCWAALTMLYMTQNSTLGSLDPSPPRLNGVRLPLDIDDECLQEEENGGNLGLSSHMSTVTTGPSQMSYILYKFRLYDIYARICEEVLTHTRAHPPPDTATVERLDDEITAQQLALNQRYQADACHGRVPAHHTMHRHILLGYSHQLRLLLNRPVILSRKWLTGRTRRYSTASRSACSACSQFQTSHARCLESASALLSLHRLLYEGDAFRPFRWYTCGLASFHAFHAAVFLAYVCMAQTTNGLVENTCGGCGNVLSALNPRALCGELESALDVFEALSATGMSRICEKASPVLRRLLR